MKKMQRWLWMIAGTGILAALIMAPGCEKDRKLEDVDRYLADNPYESGSREGHKTLVISPLSRDVDRIGQRVHFKASGGNPPYRWRVASSADGSLQVDGWSEAFYTALRVEDNEVIVTDRSGHAALARVVSSLAALSAEASPSVLAVDGDASVLSATGGSEPYQWTVVDGARGQLVGGTIGASVVYERLAAGNNIAQVTDANGTVASVTITQP